MQKHCSCYQGISYTEHFYGEYELFENTVHSQMEKKGRGSDSCKRCRAASTPAPQRTRGRRWGKQQNKKLLAEAL